MLCYPDISLPTKRRTSGGIITFEKRLVYKTVNVFKINQPLFEQADFVTKTSNLINRITLHLSSLSQDIATLST